MYSKEQAQDHLLNSSYTLRITIYSTIKQLIKDSPAKRCQGVKHTKSNSLYNSKILTVVDDKIIETIVAKSIEIGVFNTLNQLGLTSEVVTESQARKQYGRRLIDEWRRKRWIVGYPTGNPKKAKVYFKRSELETASRMLDIQNAVPANKIFNHAKAK